MAVYFHQFNLTENEKDLKTSKLAHETNNSVCFKHQPSVNLWYKKFSAKITYLNLCDICILTLCIKGIA